MVINLINSQWRDSFLKEVNSNTSDEDKYRICHKNIQSINIEDIQVRYPFKHRGAKVVTARLFTVVPTLSNTLERCYIFLSNMGNGGLLIQCSPTKQEEAWKSTIEYVDGVYDLTKSMGVCTVDIAQRIRDEHKYDKRYRERAERQTKKAKAKGTALTVRELAELSGVPASTIHSAIQRGNLRATKHDKEYWISRQDADAYIAIKNKAKEA